MKATMLCLVFPGPTIGLRKSANCYCNRKPFSAVIKEAPKPDSVREISAFINGEDVTIELDYDHDGVTEQKAYIGYANKDKQIKKYVNYVRLRDLDIHWSFFKRNFGKSYHEFKARDDIFLDIKYDELASAEKGCPVLDITVCKDFTNKQKWFVLPSFGLGNRSSTADYEQMMPRGSSTKYPNFSQDSCIEDNHGKRGVIKLVEREQRWKGVWFDPDAAVYYTSYSRI